MNKIAVLIDNRERLEFFSRRVLEARGKEFVFLHASLYSFLISKTLDLGGCVEHILLKSKATRRVFNCIEYYKGNFNRFPIIEMGSIGSIEFEVLWIFNGFQSVALQLKAGLKFKDICFFEIGNFPNKFQCNRYGVNADAVYEAQSHTSTWSDNSLTELMEYVPPHTKKKIKSSIIEFGINFIGGRIFKTVAPVSDLWLTLILALKFTGSRRELRKFQNVKLPDRYHLFVGQVNSDTQIIFQSSENNLSVLKKWHRQYEKLDGPLVYRFHPAERDIDVIRELKRFCVANDILISNEGSILQALKSASSVSMINSTSGIYALLMNKRVTCYGRCIFSEWSTEDAQTYVSAILKDDF